VVKGKKDTTSTTAIDRVTRNGDEKKMQFYNPGHRGRVAWAQVFVMDGLKGAVLPAMLKEKARPQGDRVLLLRKNGGKGRRCSLVYF